MVRRPRPRHACTSRRRRSACASSGRHRVEAPGKPRRPAHMRPGQLAEDRLCAAAKPVGHSSSMSTATFYLVFAESHRGMSSKDAAVSVRLATVQPARKPPWSADHHESRAMTAASPCRSRPRRKPASAATSPAPRSAARTERKRSHSGSRVWRSWPRLEAEPAAPEIRPARRPPASDFAPGSPKSAPKAPKSAPNAPKPPQPHPHR